MISGSPFISICTVTYNQEQFIAQCIESVLMQETDFEWELIIGDDGSTDGTGAICRKYAAAYPNRIRYYYRSRTNRPKLSPEVYPNRYNLIETFKAAGGQYIAWLDGDDYYTDVQQLQKVKQFFTTNPDCSIVFTDAHDVDVNGQFLFDPTHNVRRNLYPNDLIFHGPITSSLVFEQQAAGALLQQQIVWEVPALDQFLMAVFSCNSYMGYVATAPVSYRYHGANLMHAKNMRKYYRSTLGNALAMYKVLKQNCATVIRKRILIASRTNLKYNLQHFDARSLYDCMQRIAVYVKQSGDWKFFIDFWNTKLLYTRS